MKRMRSRLGISPLAPLCALALGVAGVLAAGDIQAQLIRIAVGSNPAGTNYFIVAAGIAKTLQNELRLPATVRPFSGSSVYLPMLHRGEITLGVNSHLDSYAAYSGLHPYPAPMTKLRLLTGLMPIMVNFLVRADSGLKTVDDLRGQRVVTIIGSSAVLERWHLALLATGGVGVDEIEAVSASDLNSAIGMLTQGRADAVSIGLYSAMASSANATIRGGVRFIGLGNDEAALLDSIPGAKVDVVSPAPSLVGIPEPTRLARLDSYLNTGTHVSEKDAYLIVKAIYENWESLQADYALLRAVPSEVLAPSDVRHPYHPGAVRFFREAGLWAEAHEERQAELIAIDRK